MAVVDVQSALVGYLSEALDGVVVKVTVPNPMPPKLVIVRREGGHRLNSLLDRPGVGIQSFAPTEVEAQELAAEVSELVLRAPMALGFCDAHEESLRSDPDPRTQSPRWYGSYTLTTFKY